MANKVFLKSAPCALDLGDGSERGLYVNQDYILSKMGKIHRGISLMYTYYPNDKEWPTRACNINPGIESAGAWDSPYENYFPYRGGREGNHNEEPFNFMNEIRQHGQDVVLTITIDPALKREDIIPIAKELRPYGRLLLRVNHECTGNWFCYTKRATYQEIADFFVMVANVMHEYAPNVKMILCAGLYQEDTGKLEMEDIFLEAHKVADIWSGDNYLSLHWGWPNDIATKETANYADWNIDTVYGRFKKTIHRLREITGQDKPMVLSEMNADGDVNGPYIQAQKMKYFMELVEKDEEKWLSAFTLYQFRDDGRLGLEITDPNNSDVGIEQPILRTYREMLHRPYFSQKLESGSEVKLPAKMRWGSSEDAEGVEVDVKVEKDPLFFELYFKDEKLRAMNLMFEFGGHWFYKKPGVKCIDLMSYFFEHKISAPTNMKLRVFAPPADGLNHPADGSDPFKAEIGDWMNNYFAELPALPEIRIEYEPIMQADQRDWSAETNCAAIFLWVFCDGCQSVPIPSAGSCSLKNTVLVTTFGKSALNKFTAS